jgi:predicted aspartyl protease
MSAAWRQLCPVYLFWLAGCVAACAQLPAEVPINKGAGRGNLLFVPIRFESGEELSFVVDTGSGRTLLDKSLESKLGKRLGTMTIQSWGTKSQHAVYAPPRLYLGGALLNTASNVAIFDFTQMSVNTGRPIKGMLSMDCLKHYCLQLDFEAGKLRFLDSSRLNSSELGKAFPVRFPSGERPFIAHTSLTGGSSTNCLIDTGFDVDGRVDGGTNKGRIRLQQCVWDGETYTNLIVGQGTNANILGLRFLARHLVTLDFPNRTMYLQRRSVGPLP